MTNQEAIRNLDTMWEMLISAYDEVADSHVVAYTMAIEALKAQPILCKDCKHYKEWESEYNPNAVVTQCMADNFPICKAIPDGWFCAGAERRTDEE